MASKKNFQNSAKSFSSNFRYGREAEQKIANIFKKCGWGVIPIEKTADSKRCGPRVYVRGEEIISPDMQVFKEKEVYWVEVKRHEALTWIGRCQP